MIEQGTRRHKVLMTIKASGAQGMTCDEAQMILNLEHQQCSPVFSYLSKEGYIEHSGHVRRTRLNKKATAYKYVL